MAASGCLDDLSSAQRRVLSLRAGLGAGPPRSRTGVARRLSISVQRVAHLENTGLQRLRTLAHGGGCTAPAAADAAVAPSTATLVTATRTTGGGDQHEPRPAAHVAAAGARTPAGARRSRPRAAASPRPAAGGVEGATQTHVPGQSGGGFNWLLPLILAVLALAAFVLAQIMRRRADADRRGRAGGGRRTRAPDVGAVASLDDDRAEHPRAAPRLGLGRVDRRTARRRRSSTSRGKRRGRARATDCIQSGHKRACARPQTVISYARWRHHGCAICSRRRSSKVSSSRASGSGRGARAALRHVADPDPRGAPAARGARPRRGRAQPRRRRQDVRPRRSPGPLRGPRADRAARRRPRRHAHQRSRHRAPAISSATTRTRSSPTSTSTGSSSRRPRAPG